MKKLSVLLVSLLILLSACNREEEFAETYDAPAIQAQAQGKDRLYMIKQVRSTKAVSENSKVWEPGDTIRIKFLTGSEGYHPIFETKVKQYAEEWRKYANINFEYVAEHEYADVKIGFDWEDHPNITYSTIGKDCIEVCQDEPSLNLVQFLEMLEEEEDEDTAEEHYRKEILRGFGHVLGLGFEYKNPTSSQLVFKTTSTVKNQLEFIFQKSFDEVVATFTPLYNTNETNYTEYDPKSIMKLPIPSSYLKNSNYEKGEIQSETENTELSETDKKYIAELYPKNYFKYIDLGTNAESLGGAFSYLAEGNNNILYGLNDCGIYRIDFVNSSIQQMIHGGLFGLGNKIFSVNNTLYFNKNNGIGDNMPPIYYFDKNDEIIKQDNSTARGLNATIQANNGTYYFGTNNGLYYLSGNTLVEKEIRVDFIGGNEQVFQNYSVTSFSKSADGSIYILTQNGPQANVVLMKPDGSLKHVYSECTNIIMFEKDGIIYLAMKNKGEIGYFSNNGTYSRIPGITNLGSVTEIVKGKNNKVYLCNEINLFEFNNNTLTAINREYVTGENIYGMPIHVAVKGLFFSTLMNEPAPVKAMNWYLLDYSTDYAFRISTKGLRINSIFEASNGKTYGLGYKYQGTTLSKKGIWELIITD